MDGWYCSRFARDWLGRKALVLRGVSDDPREQIGEQIFGEALETG
jgi:hypothetical protein